MQCCPTSTKVVGRAEKFLSTPVVELCRCVAVEEEQVEKLLTEQKSLENVRGVCDDALTV